MLTFVSCAIGKATVDDVSGAGKKRKRKCTRSWFEVGFFCDGRSNRKGGKEKRKRSEELNGVHG